MGKTGSKPSMSYLKADAEPFRLPHVRTIPQYLKHCAEESPEKEAVVFVSTDGPRVAVTFKDLYIKSKAVAGNLVRMGVKPAEVVAINLRACPEYLYATFGAIMAGAIAIGASFTYKDGSDFIALMARLETCTCLILDPGLENEKWNTLSNLIDSHDTYGNAKSKTMPTLRHLFFVDPSYSLKDGMYFDTLLVDTPDIELPEMCGEDIALLFQTSGSTGVPKVVANNHSSILLSVALEVPDYSPGGIVFSERPFTWKGGFPFDIFGDNTRIAVNGFCPPPKDKSAFLIDVVNQERCSVMTGLPTVYNEILEKKDNLSEDIRLKYAVTGGQPITKYTVSKIRGLSENVTIGYGGTEFWVISMYVINDPETFIEHASGYLLPGIELKIVDAKGEIVPLKTSGEIYTKSRIHFSEYFNDPIKTASAFTEDGWYKTDDLGRMLDDGLLIVEGRKSNMIISGGMNVAPEILEKMIVKCPGVKACVVVPIPDDVMYQVICACVTTEPGCTVDESDLRKFCEDAHADKLGLFTVLPKYYLILESIPETSTGKPSRNDAAALAMKSFKKSA